MKIPEWLPFRRVKGPTPEQARISRRLDEIRTESRLETFDKARRALDERSDEHNPAPTPANSAPRMETSPPKTELSPEQLARITQLEQSLKMGMPGMYDSDSTPQTRADDARQLEKMRQELAELKGEPFQPESAK